MRKSLGLGVVALAALAGCTEEPEIDGRRVFAENCVACHGETGRGDGPAGEGLMPPPPDLTGLTRRNGGTFPLVRVMSTIDGYRRGERFSATMPEFGAGDLGPTINVELTPGVGTPVPAALWALAGYLESIQQ